MANKPIVYTEEIIQAIAAEVVGKLRNSKVADGAITYTRKVEYGADDKRKVRVRFTAGAYMKMMALVDNFTSEVAWHGVVQRESIDSFLVTDILVYPQTVSAATVNTDQEKYQEWLNALDDDTFNALRLQGHSHVNMHVSPSATDLNHQEEIISTFNRDDQFYIFIIVNKRQEYCAKVYDMVSNTLFDGDNVEILVEGMDVGIDTFIKAAKNIVTSSVSSAGRSSAYPSYPGYGANACGTSDYWKDHAVADRASQKDSAVKSDSHKSTKKKTKGFVTRHGDGLPDDDDDDDEYQGYSGRSGIWDDIQS